MSVDFQETTEKTAARDFLHHLHDTIVLLGGDVRFAELVETLTDIKPEDVADLRIYNHNLIDATKDRLVNTNKVAITVDKPDD